LFFSRGLGRGHAVPDAAIAEELRRLRPNLEICFVSYSLGAHTLRQLGHRVIDLDLAEDPLLFDSVTRVVSLLRNEKPALVVSHEEFSTVPVARGFGLPTVFLTDWFGPPEWPIMQALKYADEIVLLDEPGYQSEPEYLREKVHYAGLVFRPLFPLESRIHCRRRRSLPRDTTVILVVPGGAGFHSEAAAPIFDLLVQAFLALPLRNKRLLWVVGEPDFNFLTEKTQGEDDISILAPHSDLTTTMMASDLVITKGNRTPLLECEILGIATMSLSSGRNFVDDDRIARIRSNTALRVRGLTSPMLTKHMIASLARRTRLKRPDEHTVNQGRRNAAERICLHLDKARVH